ncbi:MAG TPA: hypothetical protein VGK19_00495 [Capsulimonadaceae bacterium]
MEDQATRLNIVASKSKRLLFWVAISAVVVLLAIVAFSALQAHNVNSAMHGAIDPAVVQTGTDTGVTTGAPHATTDSGAKDIETYVAFLQGIEQRRAALRQQLPDAVTKLVASGSAPPSPPVTTPDPNAAPAPGASATPSAAGQGFAAYQQQWQDLIKDFNAMTPPRGAETASSNYFRVLQGFSTMLGQMSASTMPTADSVAKIETDSQPKITTDALTADQSLQQLCSKSNVAKSFSVASELVPPTPASTGPTTPATPQLVDPTAPH